MKTGAYHIKDRHPTGVKACAADLAAVVRPELVGLAAFSSGLRCIVPSMPAHRAGIEPEPLRCQARRKQQFTS